MADVWIYQNTQDTEHPIRMKMVHEMQCAPDEDFCVGFFRQCWSDHIVDFPPNASILELGCAEGGTSTLIKQQRPDVRITGLDFRPPQTENSTDHVDELLIGDVLGYDFAAGSFDCVLAVSTL